MTVDTQKLRELLETLDESPWNEREIVASVPALLAENEALRKQNEGLRERHDRDSQELRSLCQARDDARRAVEQWKAQMVSANKEIDALRAELQARQWMPIETAP